jgi:hypothetical protein
MQRMKNMKKGKRARNNSTRHIMSEKLRVHRINKHDKDLWGTYDRSLESPRSRPEVANGWVGETLRDNTSVIGIGIDSVAPPDLDGVDTDRAILGVLKDEEDEYRRNGNTRVESGGEYVVVLGPPAEVPSSNNVVEDEADDSSRDIIDGCSWRHVTGTSEDDGHVDVFPERVGPLASENPRDGRGDGTDEEEVDQGMVHLAGREHVGGTNDTPNDRGSSEHSGRQANEAVILSNLTHALDVAEHPSLDTKLGGQSDDGGDNLSPEHGARGDLHVVTELEVRGKGKTLSHGNVSPGLEHHHGDRATRKCVSDDKLSDDIETDLLVGNSLDHSDGDNVDERDHEGDDQSPDGELRWPDLNRDNGKGKHAEEDASIPPVGNLGVLGHQASVNIGHLGKRTSALDPDLLAEVEEGVREGGAYGGERKTV